MFIGLFFVSIGLLLDVNFIHENLTDVVLLIFLAFVTNIAVNTFIFRALGRPLERVFYAEHCLGNRGIWPHSGGNRWLIEYDQWLCLSVGNVSDRYYAIFAPAWQLSLKDL